MKIEVNKLMIRPAVGDAETFQLVIPHDIEDDRGEDTRQMRVDNRRHRPVITIAESHDQAGTAGAFLREGVRR